VIQQGTCSQSIFSVRNEKGSGSSSPGHERAGTEDHRPGAIDYITADPHPGDPPPRALPFDHQVLDRPLPHAQPRLAPDDPRDLPAVGVLIGLRPRPVHGWAFAAVEHAELDSGPIDRQPHHPAERVDLADDLPLGHAADGRIATQLGDCIQIARQQRRVSPHPRRRQRRLRPGMTAPDHNDVKLVHLMIQPLGATAGLSSSVVAS
jgi:hypothetical protein